MISKYLYGIIAFVLAFVILTISFLESTSVRLAYGYSATPSPSSELPAAQEQIDYAFPYPGKILPDNWLWYIKALRDRVKYMVAMDPIKKAELALLYSDKHLASTLILFERKKPDMALTVLTKGEKYLEMATENEALARNVGADTNTLLTKLATASLKHRQIIETSIMPMTPEDLKPIVVKVEDYSKNTYKTCRDALNGKGIVAPKDPFNSQ